ncbi:MAG TPA: S-layer homology domain-containing protein [Chloroflexia bacterium]|nr:S-layer homology domain-containing protein [Chloroflexia bacterium]
MAAAVASPNGGSSSTGCFASNDNLWAITASAPGDLWAVGSYYAPINPECESFYQTLTLHWDGASWTLVGSPNNPTLFTDSFLLAAAAVGASDVWAVGYADDLYYHHFPLAEHWNGSAWSLVSTPDPAGGTGYTQLNGVAAAASNNVWAVGETGSTSSASSQALMLHWDGAAWSQTANIAPAGSSILEAVALRTAADGWAVGQAGADVLIEHWNGSQWTIVPATTTGGGSRLLGVTARAADDAWAVGYNGANQPLALHWNGSQWAVVAAPAVTGGGRFSQVAAHGLNDAWAAGTTGLLHWDGSAWTVTANPPAGNNLTGLAVLPADLWAVGPRGTTTYVEHLGLVPFTDLTGNPFATYIQDLYCRGVVDGYVDNTFRPYDNALRSTLARWVVKARGWAIDTTGGPHFSDVPPSSPDYPYIETAYNHGVISGYGDGTFQPNWTVTRGQMSKMIVNALGWPIDTTGAPHFRDVTLGNAFYAQVETIYNHGAVSGYNCGATCLEFRWGNPLTRGQLAKVLDNAIGP